MFLSNFFLDIFKNNVIFTNQGICCKTKPMCSRIITNKCLLLGNVSKISRSELGSFLSRKSRVVFSIHYAYSKDKKNLLQTKTNPFMLKFIPSKTGR